MKNFLKITVCAVALLVTSAASAQKDKEDAKAHQAKIKKIAADACECTNEISTAIPKDSIIEKINSCIRAHIMVSQMGGMDEILKQAAVSGQDSVEVESTNLTIYIDQDFEEIQAYMLKNCPSVKSLMASNDVKGKYSMSKNKKALKYYDEGVEYEDQEKYDLAIVSFNKAVKEDAKFAFAWDNLGYCYRKRGNYEEAIKCYEKSLEIDPNGGMPLQNMPIAYEYLKNYKKAGECYENLIKHDAKNPEGYYGAGRAYFLDGNDEKGLDYMFKAYLMYKENNSPYVNDAQQFLQAMYNDLKENGRENLFMEAAKNNGVNVE